jgi:sortase A
MPLYAYVKKTKVKKNHRRLGIYISTGCFLTGLIFLYNAFGPILSYEIQSRYFSRQILSPLVVEGESDTVVDYSQPKNWFPATYHLSENSDKITQYQLSIPKLKINDALVQVGGDDLMKGLVQYPGTALPGQYGNTVIFGHSVLPQFFNSKNYKTIFSTLPTLKERDEIVLDADGVTYHYQVYKMIEVTPDDVSVLEQQYDNQYLSLITCVPPGTYLRRLVVRARLIKS